MSPEQRRPSPRLRFNPYVAIAAIVVVAAGVPFCTRHHSEWEDVYVRAAVDLRAGVDVYRQGYGYTYPPFQMLLALPWTEWTGLAGRLSWYAINVACLGWMIASGWALSGGRPLRDAAAWTRSEHAIFLLGLSCGLWYAFHVLAHQQTDLVIGALTLGGCRLWQTGKANRAGALLGVAAAMKCTPLLFVPYLAFRRRFVAACLMLAATLGVSLLPDAIGRSPHGTTWLREWYELYLRPMTSDNHTPGIWASDILYNQSLAGSVNRWMNTEWTWTAAGVATANRPTPLDNGQLRAIIRGCELVLALAIGFVFLRRPRLDPSADVDSASWFARECAIVIALMLVFSPMSSTPHFCTLILPGFCAARLAIARGSRAALVACTVSALLALLANKDVLGRNLYTIALWHGVAFLNPLVLIAGLAATMSRPKECAVGEISTRAAA